MKTGCFGDGTKHECDEKENETCADTTFRSISAHDFDGEMLETMQRHHVNSTFGKYLSKWLIVSFILVASLLLLPDWSLVVARNHLMYFRFNRNKSMHMSYANQCRPLDGMTAMNK